MKTVLNLRPKPHTRNGVTYPSTFGLSETFHADIEKNQSVRIYGIFGNHVNGPQPFDKTFKLGDKCEYDSYNLIYTGEIIAIGEKTIKIHKGAYPPGDNVVLDLFWFTDKNWDFDAKRIAAHNAEESYCI